MPFICDVCGKLPKFGHKSSRLGRGAMKRRVKGRALHRRRPNIQVVRAIMKGTPRKMHVCTSCIKANKVARAAVRPTP